MDRCAVAALWTLGVLASACGTSAARTQTIEPEAPFQAVAPVGFELSVVWADPRRGAGADPPRLRVDAAGAPVLLLGDRFVPLRVDEAAPHASPFRLEGATPLDDATWTADGVLLLIRGRTLGVGTASGFSPLLDLPGASMRLAPAEPGRFWLFGGEAPSSGRVFLLDPRAGVAPYLSLGDPVAAVSGTSEHAFVGVGGALLRVTPGESIVALYHGPDPILAVASAGELGVFFSTRRGVFHLREGGHAFRILDEGASALEVRGEDLFMLFDGVGVIRGHPISSFQSLAGPPGGRS